MQEGICCSRSTRPGTDYSSAGKLLFDHQSF
jgi:hypothetical protein